jgi:hypothetical protein
MIFARQFRLFGALCLLGVLSLCAATAYGAAPPTLRIAIDGSGSMRGYHATEALDSLVRDVEQAATEAGWASAPFAFHTGRDDETPHWSPWSEWTAAPVWGDRTQLDAAFDGGAAGGRALLLVTDNFQDAAGAGAGAGSGVDPLYDRIREASVPRAWLLPDLLEFAGNVDLAPGGDVPGRAAGAAATLKTALLGRTPQRFVERIGTPSWTAAPAGLGFWKIPFEGRRGLAVYAILFDPALATEFDRFVDALASGRKAAPLLVRPFAGDSLKLEASRDARPDTRAMECAKLRPEDLPKPNLELIPRSGSAGSGHGYSLRPMADLVYDPRVPGRFTAAIEISASESHVQVRDISEKGSEAAQLGVTPMRIAIAPEDRGILLPAVAHGGAEGRVMPPNLLSPVRAEGGSDGRAVFVTFDLPALVGSTVPDERVDHKVAAEFDLTVVVPGTAIALRDSVREKYFTPTAVDLARIYSPSDPVQRLASGRIAIQIPVDIPAEVFWRPPPPVAPKQTTRWRAALALALVVLAILWWLLKPRGFVAPLKWSGSKRATAVRLGGPLRPVRPPPVLNIGGTDTVILDRQKAWNRCVVVRDAGATLGVLRQGDALELAAGRGTIEWIDGRRAKELENENLYDPHDV